MRKIQDGKKSKAKIAAAVPVPAANEAPQKTRTCDQCGHKTQGLHCVSRVPGPRVNDVRHPSNDGSWSRYVRSMLHRPADLSTPAPTPALVPTPAPTIVP